MPGSDAEKMIGSFAGSHFKPRTRVRVAVTAAVCALAGTLPSLTPARPTGARWQAPTKFWVVVAVHGVQTTQWTRAKPLSGCYADSYQGSGESVTHFGATARVRMFASLQPPAAIFLYPGTATGFRGRATMTRTATEAGFSRTGCGAPVPLVFDDSDCGTRSVGYSVSLSYAQGSLSLGGVVSPPPIKPLYTHCALFSVSADGLLALTRNVQLAKLFHRGGRVGVAAAATARENLGLRPITGQAVTRLRWSASITRM